MTTVILGIDIGTTSIKICCVQYENNGYKILQKSSLAYHQHLKSDKFKFINKSNLDNLIKIGEINPFLILSTLTYCLDQLDNKLRNKVKAIGLCGQMHGVLFWNGKCLEQIRSVDSNNNFNFNLNFDKNFQNFVSTLKTWENDLASKEFLDTLPDNLDFENRKSYTGYGTATIYWYLKNEPNYLNDYIFAGSIIDFLIHLLCVDLKHPVTSHQLANSYGYFDLKTNNWSILLDKQIKNMLPKILNDNEIAGKLNHKFFELNEDTSIFVGCGDLQSAIYSVQYLLSSKNRSAILNSGTSMQLAFTVDKKKLKEIKSIELLKLFKSKIELPNNLALLDISSSSKKEIHLDIVPYFNDQYLLTASSLNGGNVISFFVNSIKNFLKDLGSIEFDENELWSKISNLTKKYIKENADLNKLKLDELKIEPRLFGERYEEIKSKFSINSITKDNFNLSRLYYTLCDSILDNIFNMCPLDLLNDLDINTLIAAGSTITNNEILRICLEMRMNKKDFKLVYENQADADFGIATASYHNLLNLLN